MMRKYIIISFIVICFCRAEAQYISEVIEYKPAPGQFINSSPWGFPGSANSIVGRVNGTLCLGGFGGYVIFRFDGAVENHPDNPYGVDFTLFGNPLIDWSEPGIVSVMKDENENGLPDDTWYELAGSDHHFSSTLKNYEVSYFNPGDTVAHDVMWTDNRGESGSILANSNHIQPYYPLSDSFPDIPGNEYTLSGTLIRTMVDTTQSESQKSLKRAFGYADNQFRGESPYTSPDNPYTPDIEHSGGDGFDIHWAVDSDGKYVDLDMIHFVKVYSAANGRGGWLGELSTEITGAVDVLPDPSISGKKELIVVKDLPAEIRSSEFQLEPKVFYMGRVQAGKSITWSSNMEDAVVDENHLLTVSSSGELILTASVLGQPEIQTIVTTMVKLQATSSVEDPSWIGTARLYPNPAINELYISGSPGGSTFQTEVKVSIYDATGRLCRRIPFYRENSPIQVAGIQPGIYMVRIDHGTKPAWLKLLKE